MSYWERKFLFSFLTTPLTLRTRTIFANLHTQYDRLNDLSFSSNLSFSIKHLTFNNYKIFYSSSSITTNELLIIEALKIRFNKPELNSVLKATKELSLLT